MITKTIRFTLAFLVCNVLETISVSDLNNGYTYINCISVNSNIGLILSSTPLSGTPSSSCGSLCSPYNAYATLLGELCACGNITDAQYLLGTSPNCESCQDDSNLECGSLTNSVMSVYAKLEDSCAPHCAKCTVNECIECDAGSNFVNGVCEPPSNPCDSHDCSDVCTPNGNSFTCSCNPNRYLMTNGKTCEDCSTNCLTCTDSTTCTACATGYNLQPSGNCVAISTNPNNMAASINGDPHVMIKNSNNGDSFCFDITAHTGNSDNGIHIIQDTPSTLKVDGKLELCGSGMSCLEEVVIEHDGNTMKFVAKDDTNNTPAKLIVGGTEYQWDQQGSLTNGSITLNSVSGTDNVKLIKIALTAADVEMNVHQFGGSTFKYLGIIFKNNVFSSNLNGALGQYIGKQFTVNTNQDELTFGSNGSPLSVSAVQRYNPASRTVEPCYLHANSNNDLVKTYLYDYS